MKSILILSDSFNGYGAEHILKWLGNGLCEHGYEITFCSIFDQEKSFDLNGKAEYYQMHFSFRVFDRNYFLKGVKKLFALNKRSHFDYVITFHTNPFLMALLGKRFCGYKIIHSERDNPYNRDTIASKVKMWLYRYADIVVFQTRGAQQFFDNKTIKKSVIIPNPITIPSLQWSYSGNCTIASVGRLDMRYKRQDVLLDAFKKLLSYFPDYKLVLYGDGCDRHNLEIYAKSLGIESNVIFKGKVSNVMAQLVEDDLFVLSSDSEGMPNALMEAMALGMPVVSTDCEPGGARALIDDGVNGLLVERSSVDDLASAIIRLVSDKNMQTTLGVNAREKMTHFAPDVILEEWIKCFN